MASNLPADPDSAAFQAFDAEDDQQILAEIQGRNLEILDRMIYSYSDRRGNTVTGLSLTGVRETVREMNRRGLARIKVTDAPPIIRETDDYIDVIVYAADELNGGGAWGTKRQQKATGSYTNPFALEQAVSKAQRNAMFSLIPAAYVVEMIREYTEKGRAHTLNGPRASARPQLPAPAARPPAALSGPSGGTSEPPPWPEQHAEDTAAAPPAATPQHRMEGEEAITEPQLKLVRSLLQRNDLDEADLLKKLGLEALSEMSKRRASQVIDRLLIRAEQAKASS